MAIFLLKKMCSTEIRKYRRFFQFSAFIFYFFYWKKYINFSWSIYLIEMRNSTLQFQQWYLIFIWKKPYLAETRKIMRFFFSFQKWYFSILSERNVSNWYEKKSKRFFQIFAILIQFFYEKSYLSEMRISKSFYQFQLMINFCLEESLSEWDEEI